MEYEALRDFLNRKVEEYNDPSFILNDPVSIPHQFSTQQDIEIAGFFAAIFSWGNRKTIIQKSTELMNLMDGAPYQFVLEHSEKDLKKMLGFKHRTFNTTDLLYFIHFLRFHFRQYSTLEKAFTLPPVGYEANPQQAVSALNGFYNYFFSLNDAPRRTYKHIACPAKNSTCKRLNMFLRWMVRTDHKGVDFGIWKNLSPAQLVCPIDLHVARVARKFGLLTRKQTDWAAALELTAHLRILDPADPVKYDFALFGLGVIEHF